MFFTDTMSCSDSPGDILSKEELQKIVENITQAKNCELVDYKINRFGGTAGFQGEYFCINLTYNKNREHGTTNLFVKTLPRTNRILTDLALKGYEKEEYIYCKLLQEFSELSLGYLLDFSAKCYYAKHRETLVLEDLRARGYFSTNSLEPATSDVIEIILFNLAKVHASSLLYEDRKTKISGKPYCIYDEHSNYLQANETDVHKCGSRFIYEYVLDKFPDIPKKITMGEFKRKTKDAMDALFEKYFKPSHQYRNVLIHGDAWLNNVLIKRDDSGKVISCCLIDFQMSKYCPPLMDVLLLFYTSTCRSNRKRYMQEWLDRYYIYLSNFLNEHGIDLNTLYDRQTYRSCYLNLNSAAICQALCFAQMIYVPSELWTILHVDEIKSQYFFSTDRRKFFEEENILNYEPLRSRMKELIEDLCEDFEKTV